MSDNEAAPGRGSKGASPYATRSLTEGSIPKTLWSLAWPAMVSGLLQTADNIAELIWAGFIGFLALASVGVAQGWIQLFNSARQGFDTASRAMIARAVGEGDLPLANHIGVQSLLLNGTVSAIMTLIGVVFVDVFLQVLGVSGEVIEQGRTYLQFRFVSTASFAMLWSSGNMLTAAGDTMTPMKAQLIARALNIGLGPVFVFGWLGFPAMGLPGSAVAAGLGQVIGAVLTFTALFKGTSRLHLTLTGLRPDFPLYWRIIRLGTPASWTQGERSVAQLILVGIVAPFGDIPLAAYSLVQRVQFFFNLGQFGMGQAAGVLAGQNLGARKLDRARATTWWALGYCSLLSGLLGAVLLLFPTPFLTIFTREQPLIEAATPWLRIVVFGFMALGAANVLTQVFNTAGDTLMPAVMGAASVWLVQQPLAIMLSGSDARLGLFGWDVSLPALMHLGHEGIAWAMMLAIMVRVAIFFPHFLWGPWWKRRVY